jgi:hypothetical protein
MRDGRWTRWEDEPTLRRFAFADDSSIRPAPWDPKASRDLHTIAVAVDDDGATVVLGEQPTDSWDDPNLPDRSDAAGWFRASPDDDWTAAKGLRGPHAETLRDVAWLGDRWIAVGWEDSMPPGGDHFSATTAVWTSRDGVRWRRERGPFRISKGVDSLGSTACELPNDAGALVLGEAITRETRRRVPMLWSQRGDRWERLDETALGDGAGWVASCAVQGETALLHGELGGRHTLWRTTDGETFEAATLPDDGDRITGGVRAFAGGFAAAGTRGEGAVVWLSPDGRDWRAHPVPSNRLLLSANLLDWNGRLVLAGSSAGDPEVWILENPEELLAGSAAS